MIAFFIGLALAAQTARPATAQTLCDGVVGASLAVKLEEDLPITYQAVRFKWNLTDASQDYYPCVASWTVRYRNVEDFYDYTADTLVKEWFTTFDTNGPDVGAYVAVMAIPGLDVEVNVRANFANGESTEFAELLTIAGMSPIWQEGDDSNTAGVAQDEPCPSYTIPWSQTPWAAVPLNETIDMLVVDKNTTLVLDGYETPRIDVLKVFGCLIAEDVPGNHIHAEKILVAGKFLVGSEESPFQSEMDITLHGFEPQDSTNDTNGSSFYAFPPGCEEDADTPCDYHASWVWEGSPSEIDTQVRFDLCVAQKDTSGNYMSDNIWAAIGFNSVNQMLGADVLACKFMPDGGVDTLDAKIRDYVNEPAVDAVCEDDKNAVACAPHIELLAFGSEDGDQYCCTVRRAMFTQDTIGDFDLSTDLYLLFAKGRIDPATGEMTQHTYNHITDTAVGLQNGAVGGSSEFYGIIGSKTITAYGGATVEIWADPLLSWTQLGASANYGDTTITLKEPATGWQVGDEIAIASSGYYRQNGRIDDSVKGYESGIRTISSISDDGYQVTLSTSLRTNHFGEFYTEVDSEGREWTTDMRAEVGLLTRRVRIHGDETSETTLLGGHSLFLRRSRVQLHYVAFSMMGQDRTLSRYPVHFHLFGNASSSMVEGCSIYDSYFRMFTIHGAQYLTAKDNFLYGGNDKALWFEEGSEEHNRILYNLILTPSAPCIWYENMNNEVVGNHMQTNTVCFDFHLDDEADNAVDVGSLGSDPRANGVEEVNGYIIPVGSVRVISTVTWPFGVHKGNVCHSSRAVADMWKQMFPCQTDYAWSCGWVDSPLEPILFEDLTVYKVSTYMSTYFVGYQSFKNARFVDNCFAMSCAGIVPGGPEWTYDEDYDYYDNFCVLQDSAIIYESSNDIGEFTTTGCGEGKGAMKYGARPFYVRNSYINMMPRVPHTTGTNYVIGGDGVNAILNWYFEGSVVESPRLVDESVFVTIDGDVDKRRDDERSISIIDVDGMLGSGMGEVCGNAGAGSRIIQNLPTFRDPVACNVIAEEEDLIICHPNLSHATVTMTVLAVAASSVNRPSMKVTRASDPSAVYLTNYNTGGSYTSGGNTPWDYSFHYPWNGPGTMNGADTFEITFVDALQAAGVPSLSDELETCDVTPKKMRFFHSQGWVPEDASVTHHYAVKQRGWGAQPTIAVAIHSEVTGLQTGVTYDFVLQAGSYSIAAVDGQHDAFWYDEATQLFHFYLRYPMTQIVWEYAAEDPTYDKATCQAAKGDSEIFLTSQAWTSVADDGTEFTLSWEPHGESEIMITMRADTESWMAFGLAESPDTMGPSDIVVCMVEAGAEDNFIISDRYASITGLAPLADPSQDVVPVSAEIDPFVSGGTEKTCTFTRPLEATDSNDRSIVPGFMNVIWAVGEDDDSLSAWDSNDWRKHGLSGSGLVRFYDTRVLSTRRTQRRAAQIAPPAAEQHGRRLDVEGYTTQDDPLRNCEDRLDYGKLCNTLNGLSRRFGHKCIEYVCNNNEYYGLNNAQGSGLDVETRFAKALCVAPTGHPTEFPTPYPTRIPTAFPTAVPTDSPTHPPPSAAPSSSSDAPSHGGGDLSGIGTRYPTRQPTQFPTAFPTKYPTEEPPLPVTSAMTVDFGPQVSASSDTQALFADGLAQTICIICRLNTSATTCGVSIDVTSAEAPDRRRRLAVLKWFYYFEVLASDAVALGAVEPNEQADTFNILQSRLDEYQEARKAEFLVIAEDAVTSVVASSSGSAFTTSDVADAFEVARIRGIDADAIVQVTDAPTPGPTPTPKPGGGSPTAIAGVGGGMDMVIVGAVLGFIGAILLSVLFMFYCTLAQRRAAKEVIRRTARRVSVRVSKAFRRASGTRAEEEPRQSSSRSWRTQNPMHFGQETKNGWVARYVRQLSDEEEAPAPPQETQRRLSFREFRDQFAFFNRRTYHVPGGVPVQGTSEWFEMRDEQGSKYYFNAKTRESTWYPPTRQERAVLHPRGQPPPPLYPSGVRVTEEPKVAAQPRTSRPGYPVQAPLSPRGRGTRISERIRQYDRDSLSSADRPGGAAPKKQEDVAPLTGGLTVAERIRRLGISTARQPQPPAQGPPALPAGWVELFDGEGNAYYFHSASGVSQWERPNAQPVLPNMPEGWDAVTDNHGSMYYHNKDTGRVSWDLPTDA